MINTYYNINSGEYKNSTNTSVLTGTGIGTFFDYNFSPYSGIKVNLSVYPSLHRDDELIDYKSKETMFEAEIISTTLFTSKPMNLWLGLGPSFQYILSKRFNASIAGLILAFGSNYQITERLYLTPELHLGANIYIKSDQYVNSIQDKAKTTDFISNGFVLSGRIGIGYNI